LATFHATIGDMVQNTYLMVSLERHLIDHTRLSQTSTVPPASRKHLSSQGRRAARCADRGLRRAKSALAIDLMLQTLGPVTHRMERFVRPDPLPVDATH
jgi:DNA-binding GntR family transcriptional regulator